MPPPTWRTVHRSRLGRGDARDQPVGAATWRPRALDGVHLSALTFAVPSRKEHHTAMTPLFVLVAGPYRSGTGDDPGRLAANVAAMNRAALDVFRAGHLPITGEAVALPLVELAGSTRVGDAAFDEIFHPVARRLVLRCDAVLRMGGPSAGADEMVALARDAGKLVVSSVDELPEAA